MSLLSLFKFHQNSGTVFGMQKHDGFSVSSDPSFLRQASDLLLLEALDGRLDVVDLDADVMDAAGGVLGQESGDGRLFTKRMQELDLGVGQVDKDHGDSVLGQILGSTVTRKKISLDVSLTSMPFNRKSIINLGSFESCNSFPAHSRWITFRYVLGAYFF